MIAPGSTFDKMVTFDTELPIYRMVDWLLQIDWHSTFRNTYNDAHDRAIKLGQLILFLY